MLRENSGIEFRFEALGTSAVLLVDPRMPEGTPPHAARDAACRVIDDFDRACSRFRPDSELLALRNHPGAFQPVSTLLFDALRVALDAARATDGLVDPTVGAAMRALGYDRDFSLVPPDGLAMHVRVEAAPGWSRIGLDPKRCRVRIPDGVELDLGATAKALCTDRAAAAATDAVGSAVLLSLGGDIAVAGAAPEDGWPILISDRHSDPLDSDGPTVTIRRGGLATSGSQARRWTRGARPLHHLLDPATGLPANEYWKTVTVAAETCVRANVASTAAFVLGPDAPDWLSDRGLSARLVRPQGQVVRTLSWPDDEWCRP